MSTDPEPSEEFTLAGERGQQLLQLRTLPAVEARESPRPSIAFLAALQVLGEAAPELAGLFKHAERAGSALLVAFPPEVVNGLRAGTLKLMQSSDGLLPTAVDASGTIVKQSRVVGSTGVFAASSSGGGLAVGALGAGGTITVGAVASVALPVLIAAAAAYSQQRILEKSLESITAVVERIEERLEDTESGVCEAAERFLIVAEDAINEGGLSSYLHQELAAHREAVEALYSARRVWVTRFKATLEQEQIERERSKGRGQPWVDAITDLVKDGKLEIEITIFIRALLSRTKLGVLAAATLAEEGRGRTALRLIDRLEAELRKEFFDLHNRLAPLARIAPEPSILQKFPGAGGKLQRAHETVQLLVDHLDKHVIDSIPDPSDQRVVHAVLDPATVKSLAASYD